MSRARAVLSAGAALSVAEAGVSAVVGLSATGTMRSVEGVLRSATGAGLSAAAGRSVPATTGAPAVATLGAGGAVMVEGAGRGGSTTRRVCGAERVSDGDIHLSA